MAIVGVYTQRDKNVSSKRQEVTGKETPTHHPRHLQETERGEGQGSSSCGQYYAVGGVLYVLLWLPQVRGGNVDVGPGIHCREARRALNVKGFEGGEECSLSLGGELLGSHGVIAQLGLPALAPQVQGFYGLICTPRGYGWCHPLPKGMGLRGGAVDMGLRLPAATSRQA